MPSGESSSKSRTRYNSPCFSKLPSQCSNKHASSVIIKKKVTSKICPSNHKAIKSKTQEPLLENKFQTKATNTDITGPLKSDTNCLTMIQQRKKCSCKCTIQKHMSDKMIQNLNNLNIIQSDKACIHTVKTISCGTQFSDNLIDKSTSKLKSSENRQFCAESRSSSRPVFYDFMGARRWALSQYQIHGPDF